MPLFIRKRRPGGEWTWAGPVLRAGDPPGTIAHYPSTGGQRSLLFQVTSDGGSATITDAGQAETAEMGRHVRAVRTAGTERLVTLYDGDNFQMEIRGQDGTPYEASFSFRR